jgi:hypothetical protein
LPACLRPPGSPFPMAASLRCPPCSTRLVDHTGLGRAGAGPHHCLSRAAGWGLLLLHGAETVSSQRRAHRGRGCWVIIKAKVRYRFVTLVY